MADLEAHRRLAFARTAFLEILPKDDPAGWLALRSRVLSHMERLDVDRITALLTRKDPGRDVDLATEADRFERRLETALLTGLKEDCGFDADRIQRFRTRYLLEARTYAVSEDLGGENFEIRVILPGRIVGHNGEDGMQGDVVWRFTGKSMRDREIELLASSRVDH